LNEEQLHILKRNVPDSYYNYKLKGIVVHHGTADQGHYYSFIQDREGKNEGWFEFNDTLVREFDSADIKEEAFGGEDHSIDSNINEMKNQNGG
jgi:ubiquitin C-terminal hydrolase